MDRKVKDVVVSSHRWWEPREVPIDGGRWLCTRCGRSGDRYLSVEAAMSAGASHARFAHGLSTVLFERRELGAECGRCAGHGTIQGIRFDMDSPIESYEEVCPQCDGSLES